jgi:CheY-like chemotaxis protein
LDSAILQKTDIDAVLKLSVLVAEDNSTNRLLIKALLAKEGIVPDFAENGLETVEKVLSQHYDLIFMDIQMPYLDGIEATKRIRVAGINTPIVALTANAFDGEREKLLAVGMSDYLSKPINVVALKRVIQQRITHLNA